MMEFNKMSNIELAAIIRDAQTELTRRKNERANKLIAKACDVLNELQSLGVQFIYEDEEGYNNFVFDGERVFTPYNFIIPEVK